MIRLAILVALSFFLAGRTDAGGVVHGEKVKTGLIRFTIGDTGEPLADAEIRYVVDRDHARDLLPMPDTHTAEPELVVNYRTDAQGIATISLVFEFTLFVRENEDDPLIDEIVGPRGVLRARREDKWIDCDFPHMEQVREVHVEWLETIEDPVPDSETVAAQSIDLPPINAPPDPHSLTDG